MVESIDRPTALIYAMVLMAAADNDIAKVELSLIGELVRGLPIFRDYDNNKLVRATQACREQLGRVGGADKVLQMVKGTLSPALQETAYALAAEVLAADGKTHPDESRLLRTMRTEFAIPELTAAALHRAAKIRCTTG